MPQYVQLNVSGNILRGMEHVPDVNHMHPLPVAVILPGLDGTKVGPHRLLLDLSLYLEKLGIASVRYDFAGGGDSDGSTEDITLASEIRDSIAMIESVMCDSRFDSHNVSLIGFSLGGYVASIVANQLGSSVKKLVMLSPLCNIRAIVEQMLAGVSSEVRYVDYIGNRLNIESARELCQPHPVLSGCKSQLFPLVVRGEHDRLVPRNDVVAFCEEVYDGEFQYCEIRKSDHAFRRYDDKQEVLRKIGDFLSVSTVV